MQYLHEDTIQLVNHVEDYRQALQLCAQPLLAAAVISADYVPAILRQHTALGAYYVLAPGLAMPHARPQEGALDSGLSLLKLAQGVCFSHADFDPVDLIIMLAAKDNHSHIAMIASLAELFSNESDLALLHKASTKQEIKDIINRY